MPFMVAMSGHSTHSFSVPRTEMRLIALVSGSQQEAVSILVCNVRRMVGTVSSTPVYFDIGCSS